AEADPLRELGPSHQPDELRPPARIGVSDHFLIRASAALEKLKLLCGEDKECSNPSDLLELYTQAILDMTYFEENKLVDEDFPEDSSQKVKELISFLSEPEILVKENNLHPKNEPRFAMFGPGLEELNTSLVLSLMSSEELCPTAGLPQRQIDGIGSGVSFQLSNQHKFNILILYSTTRKERDRAREEHTSAVNKMFSLQNEGDDQQGSRYSVIPQIQKVCEVVDGFIYVANAEAHKSRLYIG
ncbi:hypothetical protein CB1_001954012, partial [Camelus ferus]